MSGSDRARRWCALFGGAVTLLVVNLPAASRQYFHVFSEGTEAPPVLGYAEAPKAGTGTISIVSLPDGARVTRHSSDVFLPANSTLARLAVRMSKLTSYTLKDGKVLFGVKASSKGESVVLLILTPEGSWRRRAVRTDFLRKQKKVSAGEKRRLTYCPLCCGCGKQILWGICPDCDGKGRHIMACPKCEGNGRKWKDCSACKGQGYTKYRNVDQFSGAVKERKKPCSACRGKGGRAEECRACRTDGELEVGCGTCLAENPNQDYYLKYHKI